MDVLPDCVYLGAACSEDPTGIISKRDFLRVYVGRMCVSQLFVLEKLFLLVKQENVINHKLSRSQILIEDSVGYDTSAGNHFHLNHFQLVIPNNICECFVVVIVHVLLSP